MAFAPKNNTPTERLAAALTGVCWHTASAKVNLEQDQDIPSALEALDEIRDRANKALVAFKNLSEQDWWPKEIQLPRSVLDLQPSQNESTPSP